MRCIRHFGGPVDVLVMGHSHLEGITRFGATLVVNPGSATLPRNLVDVPGTVAILEIAVGGHVAPKSSGLVSEYGRCAAVVIERPRRNLFVR